MHAQSADLYSRRILIVLCIILIPILAIAVFFVLYLIREDPQNDTGKASTSKSISNRPCGQD